MSFIKLSLILHKARNTQWELNTLLIDLQDYIANHYIVSR